MSDNEKKLLDLVKQHGALVAMCTSNSGQGVLAVTYKILVFTHGLHEDVKEVLQYMQHEEVKLYKLEELRHDIEIS